MKKELVKIEKAEIDDNLILNYLKTFSLSTTLNDNEAQQFIEIAKAFQLNPFKREIYCIPYGEGKNRKLSIITGYESYIKRAEESGKLAGWKVYTIVDDNKFLKAVIEIKRNDWQEPFVHEVDFKEYVQLKDEYSNGQRTGKRVPSAMWSNKPKTMLKKVAIAQGFRLAFPCDLGGMPYTNDELPTEMTESKIIEPEIIEKREVKKQKIEVNQETKPEPKPEVIKNEPQKGNFEMIMRELNNAKQIDVIKQIEVLIPRRAWLIRELQEIKDLIEKKKQEILNNDDLPF